MSTAPSVNNTVPEDSETSPPAEEAHVDPDYEVPQGTLTETKVWQESLKPGTGFDRFGFRVGAADEGTTAQHGAAKPASDHVDTWRQARRLRKWKKMLGPDGAELGPYMERKRDKVKGRARKGIPSQLRGQAWLVLSGGRALMKASLDSGAYQALIRRGNDKFDEIIMRDLGRTYPTHLYYMQRQGQGQLALYNVMRAYSAHDPEVGYVQGMGFIAAVLLLHMPEEEAFWSLASLMSGGGMSTALRATPLRGIFSEGMPTLQLCLHQWRALLPTGLASHLEAEGMEPSLFATHWFNTLFSYSLPFGHLVRVWDVFMVEGIKVVFRVAVALMTIRSIDLEAASFEVLVDMLAARNMHRLLGANSPDQLLQVALKIPVSDRLAAALDSWQKKAKR